MADLKFNPLSIDEDVCCFRRTHPWFGDQNGIRVRIIADSINPDGDRLTTIEAIFNRWILAELNTHRMLSRNSASSRAIPVKKIMSQVWHNPAVPVAWGRNQAGMQARSDLTGWRLWLARRLFLFARIPVLIFVWILSKIGLHKQLTNRLLEPWMWHTVVVSATEWDNVWKLRLHSDAQPEFQALARNAKDAINDSTPQKLEWGMWHQPYLHPDDYAAAAAYDGLSVATGDSEKFVPPLSLVSAARCAAVSYVRQGDIREIGKDMQLATRLRTSGHWSPFEHVAVAEPGRLGNFIGWTQLRKLYPGESGEVARLHCICGGDTTYDCEIDHG